MKTFSIKSRILFSFLAIILLISILISAFGFYFIKVNIIKKAQNQLKNNLKTAKTVLNKELDFMERTFNICLKVEDLSILKLYLDLDYLFVIDSNTQNITKSNIVKKAFLGNSCGGIRIIDSVELANLGQNVLNKSLIQLSNTQNGYKFIKDSVLSSAMAIEYASCIFNKEGNVYKVIFGGKIINNSTYLIDKIHDVVFESQIYKSKPIGTTTIFLDGIRIATNVLDKNGNRAIGTCVSKNVYDNVIKKGKMWLDRAFVVTDWYLSAYEPIKDINGKIIGIFYVGILEKPFIDMLHNAIAFLFGIIIFAAIFSAVIAFVLSSKICKPLSSFEQAAQIISNGNFEHRVKVNSSIPEIKRLVSFFNNMIDTIHKRDKSICEKNKELTELNNKYLNLVSIVSHEIKNILSSTLLNACSLRDEYLGELNELQKKAINSIVKNIEYFDLTVKNFLNLSRIENDELFIRKSIVYLKEDILDISLDTYSKSLHENGIEIINNVPTKYKIFIDPSLFIMVFNNLISNAIKYGEKNSKIIINLTEKENIIIIDFFNTGKPLSKEEVESLFKRFSKTTASSTKKFFSTGLGLFITKQIIEKHGGNIFCEPKENGNSFIITIQKHDSEMLTKKEDKEYTYV